MSSITIRNLIFDLGGVILNIDPQLTVDQLRVLGWKDFYQQDNQSLNRELFYQLERGNSTPEAFRDSVRRMVMDEISDTAIDDAWSAMILDMPADRIRYLETLKKSFRIFLLSNTNEIHRIKFHREFEQQFGYPFNDLFEQNFYSHEMGMRKPDPQIYIQALNKAGIVAAETLFIDDMEINTEAAKNIGMTVLHLKEGSLLDTLPGYLKGLEIY